jgi:epoxyqueuosine reductase
MFSFFINFFSKRGIDLIAPISLADCKIVKPYLLEKQGISEGTAIMLAVPYFSKECMDEGRNVSCYAVSKDYHVFFKDLFDELLPLLQEKYPQNRFAGFADHSPVAEVDAAARAGLGVIGKNHLLITEKYSSLVFLACLVTDAILPCSVHDISYCENCGKCVSACPTQTSIEGCLSALTQKKGALTEAEQETIRKHGSVWGCDICQLSCPHTQKAIQNGTIYSKIPYFNKDNIPRLTLSILDQMSDAEFSARAYAWRGRDTIRRNLLMMSEQKS